MRLPALIAAVFFLTLATAPLAPAQAAGGFFGTWFYKDGSQAYNARAVAGAAPNALATARGARCEYRYIVQNGQRVRYEICE
jgi:hypothetical protein